MELGKIIGKSPLHSFDGSLGGKNSIPSNRMEGVALQRRNRTISTGYDTFEASAAASGAGTTTTTTTNIATTTSTTKISMFESFHGGVDAILTAAATVAQRGSLTSATEVTIGNAISDEGTTSDENSSGRPLKKYVFFYINIYFYLFLYLSPNLFDCAKIIIL